MYIKKSDVPRNIVPRILQNILSSNRYNIPANIENAPERVYLYRYCFPIDITL
jgi:hypothetical protein